MNPNHSLTSGQTIPEYSSHELSKIRAVIGNILNSSRSTIDSIIEISAQWSTLERNLLYLEKAPPELQELSSKADLWQKICNNFAEKWNCLPNELDEIFHETKDLRKNSSSQQEENHEDSSETTEKSKQPFPDQNRSISADEKDQTAERIKKEADQARKEAEERAAQEMYIRNELRNSLGKLKNAVEYLLQKGETYRSLSREYRTYHLENNLPQVLTLPSRGLFKDMHEGKASTFEVYPMQPNTLELFKNIIRFLIQKAEAPVKSSEAKQPDEAKEEEQQQKYELIKNELIPEIEKLKPLIKEYKTEILSSEWKENANFSAEKLEEIMTKTAEIQLQILKEYQLITLQQLQRSIQTFLVMQEIAQQAQRLSDLGWEIGALNHYLQKTCSIDFEHCKRDTTLANVRLLLWGMTQINRPPSRGEKEASQQPGEIEKPQETWDKPPYILTRKSERLEFLEMLIEKQGHIKISQVMPAFGVKGNPAISIVKNLGFIYYGDGIYGPPKN